MFKEPPSTLDHQSATINLSQNNTLSSGCKKSIRKKYYVEQEWYVLHPQRVLLGYVLMVTDVPQGCDNRNRK